MQLSDVLAGLTALGEERTEVGFLDRLCTLAAELCSADFCAALLLGPDGQPSALAHVGMSDAEVSALPHLPRPVGLIGVVLEGTTLRLDDMRRHPRAVGFPAEHVAMGPMLGVPVGLGADVIGAVYLTRRSGERPFSAQEQQLTVALAAQVAQLVQSLRRLEAAEAVVKRLSRSGGGGDRAQACGNSAAVRRLVGEARRTIGADVAILSRIKEGEELLVCVDAGPRAPAFQEGVAFGADEGYCTLTLEHRIPPSVPELATHPITSTMPVTAAMSLGSYCGTPVRLPDGTVYGVLCGLSTRAGIHVSGAQLESLRVIAELIATDLATTRDSEESWLLERAACAELMSSAHRSVHLQPIVELATRRVVGFEALARFRGRDGAFLPPDEVFGRAGRFGLGVQLEQEAAQSAMALLPHVPRDCYLSVNLSPRALIDPTTVEQLAVALAGAGDRVVIELTEHEQVEDYDALLAVLDRLRRLGLRLAIDDTGAGYASLQHASRMHPDIIKLDAAFSRGVHRDPGRRAVARALTTFAADVGAGLIAEGVETAAEAAELARLGVLLGQGYLFGRPAPPTEALAATQVPLAHQ